MDVFFKQGEMEPMTWSNSARTVVTNLEEPEKITGLCQKMENGGIKTTRVSFVGKKRCV